jgi:hypothetical protein
MNYNSGIRYNTGATYNDSTPTNFEKIDSSDQMIRYLSDSRNRLKNSEYIFHYTSVEVVFNILKNKEWHLGSAVFMNDRLEYENGDPKLWPNIFFSSFMTEDVESIGMWSMYAQPWHSGVIIRIPSRIARDWIKNVQVIKEIDQEKKLFTGRSIQVENDSKVRLSSVVYCNTDRIQASDTIEKLTWSTASNVNLHGASHIRELTGYVKDLAWSYEKEIRIIARFDNTQKFQRVAIDIPDDVINNMTLTASPNFEGDLADIIYDKLGIKMKTEESLFKGKLISKSICDQCDLRKTASGN